MHILRHNSRTAGLFVLALITLMAQAAKAQDQTTQGQQSQGQQDQGQGQSDQNQSQQPIPAYHSPLASQADNGSSDTGTGAETPDTRALAGVQNLSLGGPETVRSYWQPRVDIFGSADSNAQETPTGSTWGTWASFSGGVDMRWISGGSDVTLSYTGGGMISSGTNASNGIVQELSFADELMLRRWKLTFLDQVNYLPESSFGFGGLGGGTSVPGTGTNGIGSGFTGDQTLLTGRGQNLSDAFYTEADLSLTPRTSLTFVGGVSVLRYFDTNLLDTGVVTARIGYNYLWTRKDTVAVTYTYSALRYSDFDQSIDDHTIQVAYARRVTGRLAFQVAAGPQIAVFQEPITIGGSGTPAPNSTEFLWSLNTALQYQLRRIALGLSYNHGVSPGSGVLAGSETDTAAGSVTRQMSRTFSSGITGGYSRNKGLADTATPTSQTFDYWFVGANLSHPWGRTLGLTLSYQMQYQDSNAPFCVGPTCGTSVIRHLISVGVGWHERPLLF
jgi:hypothetical protein